MANKLLLANHFDLATICGTTVMFAEVLRIAPREAPGVAFAYESYEPHASPEALLARLDASHRDATCVVAVNAHIEVRWDLSDALFAWCREHGIPAYVYAHDYWPQHEDALQTLVARHGARVIDVARGLRRAHGKVSRRFFPASRVRGLPGICRRELTRKLRP